MKIGEDVVRHVAKLAELAVADADVPVLARELEAIVGLVEQLNEVSVPEGLPPVTLGPASVPLRADVVAPIAMTRRAADIAPAFEQGFFVVPRLDGLADE